MPANAAPTGLSSTGSQIRTEPGRVAAFPAAPTTGYWTVQSDGMIFNFGDAAGFGPDEPLPLNVPIVAGARTADANGYWEVAADGGVFSLGDAGYQGSTGGMRLNQPIVAAASTSDGRGYWLVASDGGVFSFGGAEVDGSVASYGYPARTVAFLPQKASSGAVAAGSPFPGTWAGHGHSLAVAPDGHIVIDYRVYAWCTNGPPP